MASLSFKKQYIAPILSGEKTSTIRMAKPRGINEGDVIEAWCGWGDGPFAHLRIRTIQRVQKSALDDDDARSDGFQDRAALMKALDTLYGPADNEMVRISFVLEGSGT